MSYYICYNATKNEKDHIGRKFGIRHLGHDAEASEGWTKWRIPGYEYIYAACESDDTFATVMAYMKENGISLVGAVHDFTSPQTGKSYMYFPIRKLDFAPPHGA